MVEHLKIKGTEVLNETKLLNLGKVNVICGKNNSGKTTLLKAIENGEKVLIGRELNETTLDFLESEWEEMASNYEFTDTLYGDREPIFGKFTSILPTKEIFKKLSDSEKVWFYDEVTAIKENFWNLFFEQIMNVDLSKIEYPERNKYNRMKGYMENHNIQNRWKEITKIIIQDIFSSKEFSGNQLVDGFFSSDLDNLILVNPKRIISDKNQMLNKVDIESDGKFLIPKLFQSKNKRTGSASHTYFQKVEKAFTQVSVDYKFYIEATDDNNLLELFFSFVDKEHWTEAKNMGLGLQDLLVILSFALEPAYPLVLIEEPENHLHPEMQRRLLRFLAEDTDENKQFIISTHSNILINSTYVNQVFFTKFENGKISVSDETKQSEILHDLGYSVADNLVSDLIILVEGPSDTPIIEEFLSKLELDAKYNVRTWALGGDIMDKHDLSVFAERYKVMALIDNDPMSDSSRKKFVKNCKDLNIPVTRLERYAIENYFSIRALREVFKAQISEDFEEIDSTKTLFEQIGMNVKNNNRKLAKAMDLSEIEGTDLKVFFDKVAKTLENL